MNGPAKMLCNISRVVALLGLVFVGGLSDGAESAAAGTGARGNEQPINIVALQLDYYDKDQKLIYTGNVVATRGGTTLKTPRLTVFLAQRSKGPNAAKSSSSDRVRRMEAAGPVTLISNDQVATGNSGVYEKSADKVFLDGKVSLTQGPNVTLGDHIVYDLKTAQAVVTGHVRSLFIPDSDNNKAGNGAESEPKSKKLHRTGAGRAESVTQ